MSEPAVTAAASGNDGAKAPNSWQLHALIGFSDPVQGGRLYRGSMVVGDRQEDRLSVPVMRTLRFMARRPGDQPSLRAIADSAGLTPRGLYAAFARELGMPPIRYLQLLRLHAVRREFIEQDPTQTTVSAVGAKFGFGKLGERRRRTGLSSRSYQRRRCDSSHRLQGD